MDTHEIFVKVSHIVDSALALAEKSPHTLDGEYFFSSLHQIVKEGLDIQTLLIADNQREIDKLNRDWNVTAR